MKCTKGARWWRQSAHTLQHEVRNWVSAVDCFSVHYTSVDLWEVDKIIHHSQFESRHWLSLPRGCWFSILARKIAWTTSLKIYMWSPRSLEGQQIDWLISYACIIDYPAESHNSKCIEKNFKYDWFILSFTQSFWFWCSLVGNCWCNRLVGKPTSDHWPTIWSCLPVTM